MLQKVVQPKFSPVFLALLTLICVGVGHHSRQICLDGYLFLLVDLVAFVYIPDVTVAANV